MKIALDIHGVLDKDPITFVGIAWKVLQEKGSVFIITGESISENLIDQLQSYGLLYQDKKYKTYRKIEIQKGLKVNYWDRLVSIQDNLIKTSKTIGFHSSGRPLFPEEDWNSFKGKYCKDHHIDYMIDDSPEYQRYFDPDITTFLLYNHKKGKDITKTLKR